MSIGASQSILVMLHSLHAAARPLTEPIACARGLEPMRASLQVLTKAPASTDSQQTLVPIPAAFPTSRYKSGFDECVRDFAKLTFSHSFQIDKPGVVNTPSPASVYHLVGILRAWPGPATEVTCSRQA